MSTRRKEQKFLHRYAVSKFDLLAFVSLKPIGLASYSFLQSVKSVDVVAKELDQKGIPYTRSKSGRAAIFFRDPDQNVLEMAEQ